MLGSCQYSIHHLSTNTSIVTVCILLLNLVVTLAKLLLVLVFSVEDTSSEPILFHDSLFESLS